MTFQEKVPALWDAFQALSGRGSTDTSEENCVKLGQLKVLIFNLCTGCLTDGDAVYQQVTEALKTEEEQNMASFTQLIHALEPRFHATFSSSKFDSITWMLCKPLYVSTSPLAGHISRNESYCFTLWRLFNFTAEPDQDSCHCQLPIRVHREEVDKFMAKFHEYSGKPYDTSLLTHVTEVLVSFQDLLRLLDYHVCPYLDQGVVGSTLDKIYSESIVQVLDKGWIHKKASSATIGGWTKRWFVLTPDELKYYEDETEKHQKGETLTINQDCSIVAEPSGTGSAKHRHFKLKTPGRLLEMRATDERSRTNWITALQKSIRLSGQPNRFRQEFLHRAQERRKEERRRQEEEDRKQEVERKRKEEERRRQEEEERRRQEEEQRRQEEEERRRKEDEERKRQEEERRRQEEEQRRILEQRTKELEEEREREREEREREKKAREELEKLMEEARKKMEELLSKFEQDRKVLENNQNRDQEELKRMEEERRKLLQELQNSEAEKKKLEETQEELRTQQENLKDVLEQVEQAKKDEEIVRKLQAVALKEEMEKREQVELEQRKLQELLMSEKLRAEDLEAAKKQQEMVLEREKERLADMERQKEERRIQAEKALAKLQEVEKDKESLEKKIDKKKKEIPKGYAAIQEKFELIGIDPNKIADLNTAFGAYTDIALRVKAEKFQSSKEGTQPKEQDTIQQGTDETHLDYSQSTDQESNHNSQPHEQTSCHSSQSEDPRSSQSEAQESNQLHEMEGEPMKSDDLTDELMEEDETGQDLYENVPYPTNAQPDGEQYALQEDVKVLGQERGHEEERQCSDEKEEVKVSGPEVKQEEGRAGLGREDSEGEEEEDGGAEGRVESQEFENPIYDNLHLLK